MAEENILDNSIIWYHGTTVKAYGLLAGSTFIDVNINPYRLDFGIGFYLTTNYRQACKWATDKSVLLNSPPMVLKYQIDFNRIQADESITIKNFGNTATSELLEFVKINRKKPTKSEYALIYGRVLDGKNDIFQVLENENLDLESKLKYLFPKRYRNQNQLCITSGNVLKYITLKGVDKI